MAASVATTAATTVTTTEALIAHLLLYCPKQILLRLAGEVRLVARMARVQSSYGPAVRQIMFAPEVVVWAYESPPQQALRALLGLVHPGAPTAECPAPLRLSIPRVQQRPMAIRFPSSPRAGARATRLTSDGRRWVGLGQR